MDEEVPPETITRNSQAHFAKPILAQQDQIIAIGK